MPTTVLASTWMMGVKVNYGKFGDLLADVTAVTGGNEEPELEGPPAAITGFFTVRWRSQKCSGRS